ncbi:TlpA family protein disulfide reductase [Nocardioides caeni]|uniref:TlpA family protein disulfide reductase n=1 Tax=Nocardioides caeni TaxID=574700 RepID=A0A4S8N937_9ACTN|nr:TlpA disulfide reductase family protein [Nocardioides caeni]THV12907.1 TlpA family protein disulfide reductase [Nocardioides caeni]
MRGRGARGLALAALAVLLVGCDAGEPSALECRVEVDTPDLVADREAAGTADCPEIATSPGAADLPDLELQCLGSTSTMALSDVQGPAMINFWASNCGPCRDELPALQAFHERYGDQVAVIGVDFLETYPAAAIDLNRLSGVTYPSLADACGDLNEAGLAIYGLPQFVFVAADGSVSNALGGKDSLADVVALVEKHLDVDLEPTR